MKQKFFKTLDGRKIPLPLFFPDATRGFIKTLDSVDIKNTHTLGILVNTYHLYKDLGESIIKKHGNIKKFMNWDGAIISDSGGFQAMSLSPKITDDGITFKTDNGSKVHLTPEESISFQLKLKTDLVVVLDDFTPVEANYEKAKETVERTIRWAKRCKKEFQKQTRFKLLGKKPYLIGVVQGGKYQDLRKLCAEELVKIGFDGLGYGGWPIKEDKSFDYESALTISQNVPENYFLYGLGIGKPQEVVNLHKLGFNIFDCVLPTRDARHKRLYVYNAKSIKDINITKPDFYSFYTPDKQKYLSDNSPVSDACDCLLCTNYSKGYLAHLFRSGDYVAGRLATIHNLRFYSLLMEKLRS